MTSSLPSSRVKDPEKHRQRRPELPRINPVEQTRKILSPELPSGIYKRASVRSYSTAITTESSVVSEDISVACRVEEVDEEQYMSPKGKVEEENRSSFFIPGITGTARCLQTEERKEHYCNSYKRLSLRAMDHQLDSIREVATKSSIASESREAKRSETSHKSSHGSTSRRSSVKTTTSDSYTSSELDNAHLLYGAVVDSIQTRREEGFIGLGEEEFQQRMLQALEKDATSTDSVLSAGDHPPDLRNQVSSIRSLLNDYERRKKVLKRRKQKESRRKSISS